MATPLRPLLLVVACILGCQSAAADTTVREATLSTPTVTPLASEAPPPLTRPLRIVARAREEVARRVVYDPAYVRLAYPGGDLDESRGVCTDVVIRAFRAVGVDLQRLVHEDILARPSAYPRVQSPDANIDHRRVGPLLTYLEGHAKAVSDYQPGDIVVWAFRPSPWSTPDHVGIVSDRVGPRGLPLVVHNIGPRPSEDDVVDAFTMLGHFRL
jgi:uncharacterized protein